jgi:hypothetical protein
MTKTPRATVPASYRAKWLDIGVHYFLVTCLCALVALCIAALIDPRLQHWITLTALLLGLKLALEWFGPFWIIKLDEHGVVMRAAVWRRRVRYEDIRFVQAGTLLETFTSARSTQTLRIETRGGKLTVQLDADAARQCVRLITDHARSAEAIDMTAVDLSSLMSMASRFASGVEETPSRCCGGRSRIARYYSSAGGCILAMGLALAAILIAGLIRILLAGPQWDGILRSLYGAGIVAVLAGNLIPLGRHLLNRAKRKRR